MPGVAAVNACWMVAKGDPDDPSPRRRPSGLIDRHQNDTQAFDAEQIDRLDFFVAELKKRVGAD